MQGHAPGFTLLELMVTVTILAVGAAIAVPSYSAMLKSNRTKSVASELLAALSQARSEAARRGQPVSICKSSDGCKCGGNSTQWESGWIVFVDKNPSSGPDGTRDNTCPYSGDNDSEPLLLSRRNLPDGITVRFNNPSPNSITYARTGIANKLGTFAICTDSNESKAQAIVVNATRVLLSNDSNGNGIPEKTDSSGKLVDITSCESP